ncbi:MAG: hypothetical protein CL625_04400 [Arenimonas sp.]|jgi:hypothetical protein|nr:hypothetical protein [Arenimonas sp.]
MSALLRALSAERLKLHGTLAAWTCLVAPAVVVGVYVLQISFSNFPANRAAPSPDLAWASFVQATLVLWAFLMLPLLVTLQAALLAGLDHQGNQWKHLLALAALVALSQLAMLILLPLGGMVLSVVKPAFGLLGGPPWGVLVRDLAEIYAACLLLIALHTWIALRWRSFAVAVGVGMGATVMGFLIGQSGRFGPWYPWSLPMQTLASDPAVAPQVAAYSVVAAVAVAGLGLAWFQRSEPA